MKRLNKEFFNRPANVVAKELLGKILIRHSDNGDMGGFIVEVEAYMGAVDPANYGYNNNRDQDLDVLYGEAGHGLVYQIDNGYCFNITCGEKDDPQSVLIRAVEPCFGMSMMLAARRARIIEEVSNSPKKLCESMYMDIRLNGVDLENGDVGVYIDNHPKSVDITVTTRVVDVDDEDAPFRYCIMTSPFISRKK